MPFLNSDPVCGYRIHLRYSYKSVTVKVK